MGREIHVPKAGRGPFTLTAAEKQPQSLCLLGIKIDFPRRHRWKPSAQELRLMVYRKAAAFLEKESEAEPYGC